MEPLPHTVLRDPAFRVPSAPPAAAPSGGLAWLRAHVPRFHDGPEHRRLRDLVDRVLAGVGPLGEEPDPTRALLVGLGLDPGLAPVVAEVAAAYQPHTPQSAAADDAADLLVDRCGGRTDEAAARVCVLVQAHAAVLALAAARRSGDPGPPVPTTRRVAPDGSLVAVSLEGAPFGDGPHRCPGEALADRLVARVPA